MLLLALIVLLAPRSPSVEQVDQRALVPSVDRPAHRVEDRGERREAGVAVGGLNIVRRAATSQPDEGK